MGCPSGRGVQVLPEGALAVKHTVRFDPARWGRLVAGNHLIVQSAEAFALFAPLAPGDRVSHQRTGGSDR